MVAQALRSFPRRRCTLSRPRASFLTMPIRWAPAVALLLIAGAAAAAVDTTADSPKEVAMAIARKARRAEKAGKSAQAYIFYSEAAALQPRNRRYRSKMELLRTDASRQSKPIPA